MKQNKIVHVIRFSLVHLFLMIGGLLFLTNDSHARAKEIPVEEILSDLVQLNTVNPPGNEWRVAEYLQKIFVAEGIEHSRLGKEDGRDNIIARLHGDGSEQPILLYSHSDVVTHDPGWGVWSEDPFGGAIKDGNVHGRGAIDAKGLLVCHLDAFLRLHRSDVPLNRDVIFLVVASEETGGGYGMRWLLREHRELIDAEIAFGEGGRVWEENGDVHDIWIQLAEKSAHNLTVSAVGDAAHAAIPNGENAIHSLVRALGILRDQRFSEVWNDVNRSFVAGLSAKDKRHAPGSPFYRAITSNTLTVTKINGGVKTNVVPAFASANINLRLMPGEDLSEFVVDLNDLINDKAVTVRHKPWAVSSSELVSPEHPAFGRIEKIAISLWPEAKVLPYLSPGTSDASKLRAAGIPAFGFMPFPLTHAESSTIHGIDERVRVEALHQGADFIYQLLVEFAGTE